MTGNSASGQRPFYQARTGPEFGQIGDGIDTIPATFGPASYAASNFTPPFYIDSGRYLASSFNLWGVESVYQRGAFSAQGEFMATDVQSVAGPILYTGAYGEVMYRLTGEHRGYDKRLASLKKPYALQRIHLAQTGRCQRVGCVGSLGASLVRDAQEPREPHAADYISGTNSTGNGTLTDSTLGVTWFWNYHTKLQFNWIHACCRTRTRDSVSPTTTSAACRSISKSRALLATGSVRLARGHYLYVPCSPCRSAPRFSGPVAGNRTPVI